MKITFIRHGETEYNKKNLFCGLSDCNITEESKKQAQVLQNVLPEFDMYYCSPLKRTKQTLNSIFPEAVPIIDDRIIEISLGSWEGLSKSSVDQDLRKNFRAGTYTPEGAESNEFVEQRISSFLKDLFTTYNSDENILVVTHNGVLRTTARLLGTDPISNNLEFFTIDSENFKNFL